MEASEKKSAGKTATSKKTAGKKTARKAANRNKTVKKSSARKSAKTPVRANSHGAKTEPGFPIVGIGASAGGLEAFEQFFTNLPSDTGMAFVLVQHLDPTHKSLLAELVWRYTRMPVVEVEDGMSVRPDNAYIIPPNRDMAILHGVLHLIEPAAPRGQRLPIDYFFRSLAQDQQERAIAIVLSGTGSDGTLGIKAIKGEGGMVMVQSPQSARYDGMPRNALNTGVADYVLPADELPAQLIAFAELAIRKHLKPERPSLPAVEDQVKKLFILLRGQTGHDFSLYKDNTIMRRIERRMSINQIGELRSYVRYLQQNPLEIDTLFKELLIGVTSFFRDPEAFESLDSKVLPAIFENRPLDRAVRIWVPGCSTGEEAYSLAILLRDYMETNKLTHDVQIFATDIDGDAIDAARQAVYPDSIAVDLPAAYLKRYFVHHDGTLQVEQTLREMMVFATQSIIKDPPFSHLDLVSCRNLLIYMGSELQQRVLPLFHYAINPGGYLFLGHSESLGDAEKLFTSVDRKWKIFRSSGAGTVAIQRIGFPLSHSALDVDVNRFPSTTAGGQRISYRDVAEKMLLQDHTPVAVLVDEHNNALFVHGSTGDYLEPAPGEANLNLLSMARPKLRLQIVTALRKARSQKKDIRIEGLRLGKGRNSTLVDIAVRLVREPPAMRNLLLVMFDQIRPPASGAVDKGEVIASGVAGDEQVRELKHELATTREHLQTTIEELETSNEELTSTNEEMQSSNEELQSTNEELETSKEELQSVNEELMTVNTELETKVQELSHSNNDMNNLLAATQIGTLFLDYDLNIKRFTPPVAELIKLIQSDLGRPLSDIAYNFGDVDLVALSTEVLAALTPYEQKVSVRDDRSFLLRILPYRTTRNVIDGVVITFIDITRQTLAERLFHQSLEHSLVATIISNVDGEIQIVNGRAESLFGWTEQELLGRPMETLVPELLRAEYRRLAEEYLKAPTTRAMGQRLPLTCQHKDGSPFQADAGVAPLATEQGTRIMTSFIKVED